MLSQPAGSGAIRARVHSFTYGCSNCSWETAIVRKKCRGLHANPSLIDAKEIVLQQRG